MTHQEMVAQAVAAEWEMFVQLNSTGTSECGCENEYPAFAAMRQAQYEAWDEAVVASYLKDLADAKEAARNLIAEKYIHMMRYTEPEGYEKVKEQLAPLSDEVVALSDEVCAMMIEETLALNEKYPLLSGAGRPIYTKDDNDEQTSVETYQKCELYTLSAETLHLLKAQIEAMHQEGKSLAAAIQLNSVKVYGYESMEQAEAEIRRQLEETVFVEPNFGCPCCMGEE